MIYIKDHLTSTLRNNRFYTIAIDGRGGSGKTNLVDYIKPLLPGFIFLNFDDYFEPKENSDAWGFLNKQRFTQDVIEPLKKTNTIIYRPYDWHKDSHITEKTITIKQGFCLEGFSSFSFDLDWDLKIWVETPKEICLERGVRRDANQPQALHVWRDIWQHQEDKYIEKIKPLETADIILDGTKPFEEQIS